MSSRRGFLARAGAVLMTPFLPKQSSGGAAPPEQQPASAPGNAAAPYRDPRLPVERRVQDLLRRMTLEEKVAQTRAVWPDEQSMINAEGHLSPAKAEALLKSGIGEVTRPGAIRDARAGTHLSNAFQKFLMERTRLGIPAIMHEESLHGLLAVGATSFPQAIALASTWDPVLVEKVFSVAAAEARSRGAHQVLTPVLGAARDPRWGRTEETYGEDPFLASRIAVACVRGFQGAGPGFDRRHVVSTIKHFAVHSQPEGGVNLGPGNYSERIIRENFLPSFHAAVTEAGAMAVMASYNEIDGIPSHANRRLLQKILREEWGFRGIVVSDYEGVIRLETLHHVAADPREAGRKAIEAGVDVELPKTLCYSTLVDQVRRGLVSEATLDEAVARVLRLKFLLGLFEKPYADPEEAASVAANPEHRRLALEAARKAIILLKNQDRLLPLDRAKIKSLAVIGPNAAVCHLGNYSGKPVQTISILEGIRRKVGGSIRVEYAEGCKIVVETRSASGRRRRALPLAEESAKEIAHAAAVARSCDLTILVLGGNERTCGEGTDRNSLEMMGPQNDLVKAIVATGKPVIVFLINGRPLSIDEVAERVPAILEGWYLGQETGTAVADVLFGDSNPGGKLPITFPRSVGNLPCYYNYKPSARRGYLLAPNKPLFPFGHGLSYTTFEYSKLMLSPPSIMPGGETSVSVEVQNTGAVAGDEVVQLYIRDEVSSVTRPVQELRGFERIALNPGETRTVQFKLTPAELSFLNEEMERVVEPGAFSIMVGTSSASYQSAKLQVLKP